MPDISKEWNVFIDSVFEFFHIMSLIYLGSAEKILKRFQDDPFKRTGHLTSHKTPRPEPGLSHPLNNHHKASAYRYCLLALIQLYGWQQFAQIHDHEM